MHETGEIDSAGGRELRLRFTGSAKEYFRIWIVNLALNLFTLGLFSPWAKVRRERYFYSHLELDGTPFQYLARPLPILKGRLLAVGLLLLWFVTFNFSATLLPVVTVAALAVVPWVIARSAAFKARYSAYRNMTFHFSGTYSGVMGTFVTWGAITVVSCGLGFPWLRQRLTRYLVRNTTFGGVHPQFSASDKTFAKAYLLVFVCSALAAALVQAVAEVGGTAWYDAEATVIALYVSYFLGIVYLKAHLTNVIWNGTTLGAVSFRSTLSARELLWVYGTNLVAIVISAGLLVPWAMVRLTRYRVDRLAIRASSDLREFEGSVDSTVRAAGAEVGEIFDFGVSL